MHLKRPSRWWQKAAVVVSAAFQLLVLNGVCVATIALLNAAVGSYWHIGTGSHVFSLLYITTSFYTISRTSLRLYLCNALPTAQASMY